MILIIDNYDSFTYNLVQRFGEIDSKLEIQVVRNDQITLEAIQKMPIQHLVISPGPCTPLEAGISNQILENMLGKVPILGVCLGHQCIGHVFGGKVIRNYRIMHGKVSPIYHDGKGVFSGLSNPFEATRYHSLVIQRDSFQHPDFEISAWTQEGEIMGVRHKKYELHGVQFHPESFLTLEGPMLLANFLRIDQPIKGIATPI